jgi:hypothetical protein
LRDNQAEHSWLPAGGTRRAASSATAEGMRPAGELSCRSSRLLSRSTSFESSIICKSTFLLAVYTTLGGSVVANSVGAYPPVLSPMALADIRSSLARTEVLLDHIRKHIRLHPSSRAKVAEEEDVRQLENIYILLGDLKALGKAYGENIFAGNDSFLRGSLDDYEELYKLAPQVKAKKRWMPLPSLHDLRTAIHEKTAIESSKLLVFVIQFALV